MNKLLRFIPRSTLTELRKRPELLTGLHDFVKGGNDLIPLLDHAEDALDEIDRLREDAMKLQETIDKMRSPLQRGASGAQGLLTPLEITELRDLAIRRGAASSVGWTFTHADDKIFTHGRVALNRIDELCADNARLIQENEALKKAKSENDERFMIERDEARSELESLRKERTLTFNEAGWVNSDIMRMAKSLEDQSNTIFDWHDPTEVRRARIIRGAAQLRLAFAELIQLPAMCGEAAPSGKCRREKGHEPSWAHMGDSPDPYPIKDPKSDLSSAFFPKSLKQEISDVIKKHAPPAGKKPEKIEVDWDALKGLAAADAERSSPKQVDAVPVETLSCTSCGNPYTPLVRSVGIYWTDSRKDSRKVPIGSMLCQPCFAKQGLPEELNLGPSLAVHTEPVKSLEPWPEDFGLDEAAWGIIANAFGGDWSKATPGWHSAAVRWRDRYFATLRQETQSEPAGPDSFPGTDEGSHYMSQKSAEKIREEIDELGRIREAAKKARQDDLEKRTSKTSTEAVITLCACCGVEWEPSKASPSIDRLMLEKAGEKPLIERFHKKCYEFVKSTVDKCISVDRSMRESNSKPKKEG